MTFLQLVHGREGEQQEEEEEEEEEERIEEEEAKASIKKRRDGLVYTCYLYWIYLALVGRNSNG